MSDQQQQRSAKQWPVIRWCQTLGAMSGALLTIVVFTLAANHVGGYGLGLLTLDPMVPGYLLTEALGIHLHLGSHWDVQAFLVLLVSIVANAALLFLVGTVLGWFIKG
jgi:hypothetical protein